MAQLQHHTGMLMVRAFILLALCVCAVSTLLSQTRHSEAALSTTFLENRGQVIDTRGDPRPDILFTGGGPGVRLYLRRTGISYVFYTIEHDSTIRGTLHPSELELLPSRRLLLDNVGDPARAVMKGHRVDMDLVGANPHAVMEQSGALPDRANFYLPHCPDGITGLQRFSTITYHDIYPSIDLEIRGTATGLKYDLIVRPGGDVSAIRLRYSGADGVDLTSDGGVRVASALGHLLEERPFSYQVSNERGASGSEKREIISGYRLRGDEISFSIGPYDKSRALVIDPTLVWGTYYGGDYYDYAYGASGGTGWGGFGQGMAVDLNGNIGIDGGTYSIDFPLSPGPFQGTLAGAIDAYILSLNPNGTRRWATFFGGSDWDYGSGLVVDTLGCISILMTTRSSNLPITAGAFQTTIGGGNDVAVARFDPSGQRIWATYFGSASHEHAGGICVDRRGDIAYCGYTTGTTISVTAGTFQPTAQGGFADAFVVKMDSSGRRIWGTYVGGASVDQGECIGVDSSSNLYIGGRTNSTNFPVTTGAVQSSFNGNPVNTNDIFVISLDSSGRRNWGTYLGGTNTEWSGGIGTDLAQNVYLGVSTISLDFPVTANAPQTTPGGNNDCVIAKFTPSGRLIWSGYYGASQHEYIAAMAVAPNGHIYTVGQTGSAALLKSLNNYQTTLSGLFDAFVVEFDSSGRVVWDSYYGGSLYDWGTGVSGDGKGNVYISGYTNSLDLPVRRAIQGGMNTSRGTPPYYYDVFIARFCDAHYPSIIPDGPTTLCAGDSVVIAAPYGYDYYRWFPTNDSTRTIVVRNPGTYSVHVEDTLGCNGTSNTVRVVVHPLPRPDVTLSGPTTFCQGDSVVLRIRYSGARSIRWTNGSTADSIVVKTAGTYSVRVIDSNGCIASSPEKIVVVNPVPSRPRIVPSDTVWICADSLADLNIGGVYYRTEWNNGELTPSVKVAAGRYWGRVYNEQSCSAGSDTVVVVEYPTITPVITPLGPLVICPGDSVLLDAGAGYARYEWSTGEPTRIIAVRGDATVVVTVTDTNGCRSTSEAIRVTTFATAQPDITPIGKTTLCDGDSLLLDGGTGQFESYRWSTGDTTARITVRRSGRYRVTVTTFDGCRGGSDSIDVTVHPRPVATINGPTTVCVGSTQLYSVPEVAGYVYQWSLLGDGTLLGRADSGSISVKWGTTGPGQIEVRVTNPVTGCMATATVSVTLGTELIPTVTASRFAVCPGDSVELDAGGGYVSYQWSTGATSRKIHARAGFNYTVRVRDADGCQGTSQPVVITEVPSPAPIVLPLGSTILCDGDSVVLDAGAGWRNYLWSDGGTDRYLIVRGDGSYDVRVTDSLGCEGVSPPINVDVTARPTPEINGPVEVCRNSEGTYTVEDHPGAGYRWSVVGGTLVSGQGTSQIVAGWGAAGVGSVQCEETAAVTNCRGESPVLGVTIGTQLRPTITPGGTLGFCPGDSVVLDAGAGYASYRWSTGATGRRITVRTAGVYFVTVSDAGGCSGRSGDVAVREYPRPVPSVRALGSTTIYEGDSVVLEVADLYAAYLWTTGASTRRIVVKSSGDYNVTVADSNGCVGTSAGGIRITVVPRAKLDTVIADVEVGRISGSPGDRVIVPIRLRATNLDTTRAIGYRAELRYNRTLMLPIGATPAGVVDGADRVIPLVGLFPSDITTGGDLARIEFIAMLGNAEITGLHLTSFELIGAPVAATITDGEFRLTGLCENGGTRLVNADGSVGLKSVRPNPTSGICAVEYEVVESGMTRLYVVDLLGRRMIELQAGTIDPGRYLLAFDAGMLASGMYTIVLETPTDRRSAVLQVIR